MTGIESVYYDLCAEMSLDDYMKICPEAKQKYLSSDKLTNTFSPEQNKLFLDYEACETASEDTLCLYYFKKGFEFGIKAATSHS